MEQVGPRAMHVIVMIVLARLLPPAAFGLVGMLALFLGIARAFADSGLSASLIQRKTLTDDDTTTVFALNVLIGIVLALLLCALSPLVARFYGHPILAPMLCVASGSLIISSLFIVQSALLSRNMQFRKSASAASISTLAGGVTGIVMAVSGYGVWSLIGSTLAAAFARAAAYWHLSDWRPRGRIRLECIRSMWSFSSYLLLCNLIREIWQNTYSVLIGKFYSVQALGYYDRANNLRMMPAAIISGIVCRVAFPLFSKHQDDKVRLLSHIRELVRSTFLLSCSGLTLLALLADPLIPLLLSEKWRPSVPLLQILCFASICYPISGLYLLALQALGHSNLNFRLESIKIVNGMITALLVYPYGVKALAMSMVGLSIVAYFINAYYNVKLLRYTWSMQARDLLPILIMCGLSGCLALYAGNLLSDSPFPALFLKSAVFFVTSGLLLFALRHSYFKNVAHHVTWFASRFQQRVALRPS